MLANYHLHFTPPALLMPQKMSHYWLITRASVQQQAGF